MHRGRQLPRGGLLSCSAARAGSGSVSRLALPFPTTHSVPQLLPWVCAYEVRLIEGVHARVCVCKGEFVSATDVYTSVLLLAQVFLGFGSAHPCHPGGSAPFPVT